MKRRLLAAFLGLAIAALWATPAYAQSPPEFVEAPAGGKVATGSKSIKVHSEPANLLGIGLEKVFIQVIIKPKAGGGTIDFPKKEGANYEVTWNAGQTELNGAYDIVAVATTPNDTTGKSASVGNVLVNNPPTAPSGVNAEIKDGAAHVSWNGSPEKDILGYRVTRTADGGGAAEAYSGPKTSFTDSSAPHSKALVYRVTAVRKSPVSNDGVASTAVSSDAVTVPAPPPPVDTPAGAPDPNNPTVPGTNIVTGKETPKAPIPGTNKNFGKAVAPIVKAAPAGTAFDESLPYTGTPPENFSAASGGDPSLIEAAADDGGVTVANPIKFIVGGIVLLGVSAFLWRASRKLLVGTRPEDQISPHRVNFPEFRINRG